MGNMNNKSKSKIKSSSGKKRVNTPDKKISSKILKNIKLNTEPKEENIEDNNIRSFSDNNLIKILNENNQEENLPNSIDTNDSSIKSNTNEIIEEIEVEDNNSEENEEDEKNKESKKELIITYNIKKVFIDSKLIYPNYNNKEKDQTSNSSLSTSTNTDEIIDNNNNIIEENKNNNEITKRAPSISTFDYELNIFRDSGAVRESYISKLITKNIWNPGMKPKCHNSLIIFDWDDTLLPTSFLTPNGSFTEDIHLSQSDTDKINEIEKNVNIILKESIEKGNVYIITNAGVNWVQFSASIFYPSVSDLLKKIKIISARGEYEKAYPGNLRQWKIQAFLNLLNNFDNKLVTNIICIGDSLFEMEAGRILASKFKEAFVKTIKFREAPKLDELLKQLKLVAQQFGQIYSTIKNLNIRIEKKKKEK